MMQLERAFARAGGMLVAGTDPTGSGGVIPGYSNQRQIELLVEAGFTPLEAISIGTLNGAKYLGPRLTHRIDRAGQTGGPRAGDRQSGRAHRRCAQRGDRVPPGHRVRSGEARGVGDGKSGVVVTRKDVKRVIDAKRFGEVKARWWILAASLLLLAPAAAGAQELAQPRLTISAGYQFMSDPSWDTYLDARLGRRGHAEAQ